MTSTVNVSPARSIVSVIGRPTKSCVTATSFSLVGCSMPSTPTIRSPGRSPAASAGEVTTPSRGATSSSLGLLTSPTSASHTVKHRRARTKCVAGPATITRARCHLGLAPYVRGRSSAGTSSNGLMPAIFT